MGSFSECTTHESYRIKEGMKAYLCLPKHIANGLKPGDKISWLYAGNIEQPGSVGLGRAAIITKVVEKKWAGLGYRRVIFELSQILYYKTMNDLVHELEEAMRHNESTRSVTGMKVATYEHAGEEKHQIFIFNPEIVPLNRKDLPFPFEESL